MSLIQIVFKKLRGYFSKESREIRRLLKIPRYMTCNTNLLGGIRIADSLSFVAGYDEIFVKENYKFISSNNSPLIIDCGSNIGLSLIYFKSIYPNAQIICFEPDPAIFSILQYNSSKLGYDRVELHNKALSNSKGSINFISEGGFSGRVVDETFEEVGKLVGVDILSDHINRDIDFLKIDIEGHELVVLEEIKHKLNFIKRIFIEYHSFEGKDQPLEKVLTILKEADFRIHIKEAYAAKNPFVNVPVVMGMDNQLEIYAWKQ